MKKILFYCQYLSGMGHLVRSTEIVRNLVKDFQVYFITGGPPIQGFEIPPSVEVINLPALWLEDGEFRVEDRFNSVDEVKEIRKNQLIAECDRIQPDCIITEFFPFGRHKLLFELIPLLDHVRSTQPSTQIVCSLRDVIKQNFFPLEEELICQLANQYFDLILFHSDPIFQRFETTFPRYKDIQCDVQYTGFVAQSPSSPEKANVASESEPMILVSVGGGRIGYELLEAAINSSWLLEMEIPHKIQIFTGPFLPESEFLSLQQAALNRGNVKLDRYASDLLSYMEKAALSISLTGYNTTMNILRTGVRAIVVPLGHDNQDREQLVRTSKLEQLGIVEVIRPNDLNHIHLTQKIMTCLKKKPVARTSNLFDLEGAPKTASFLKALLNGKIPAASAVYSSPK
ncbi:MAG: glycosyltransferase [Coleofasciculaceae cyanobacterium]